jgi:hypothetical protein
MYMQCVPWAQGSLWRGVFDLGVFTLATVSAAVFYVASQFELFGDWRTAIKYLPVLMSLGVGLSLSNAKGILEALFGKKSEFVRTPKYGGARGLPGVSLLPDAPPQRRKRNLLPYAEFGMGLYMIFCAVCSVADYRSMLSAPFLVIFAFGFFYVSVMSFLSERSQRQAHADAKAEAVAKSKA